MPDYDFRTLSPIDFEHLARDVLNADLGLALHAYAPGRDQGIDLRQVMADRTVIVVQCKHYLQSSWSTFLRAVRREGERGDELHADRYLFVTSRALTPSQQDQIVEALGELFVAHDDVWGGEALNAALLRHPEVERRHIKLWLASTVVLDSLLNAGRWQRGEATLDEVRDQSKLWVQTPAYNDVLDVLEREGVCIVSGLPGVGKTFLAQMVMLSAVTHGWEVVHVSGDIEEAWDALRNDRTNQLFYYNDFLGEGELQVASKNEPTNLAQFIERIEQLREHKRFIMTTRTQILQQAAASSYDPLRNLVADAGRIGVRINGYPTHSRAEILFNHLYFSGIPESDRGSLAVDNRMISIIDHPAYNPRLIELGLRTARQKTTDEILDALKRVLDQPDLIWGTSFRDLPPLGKQILLTMGTLPARPWPLHTIRRLAGPADALAWTPTLRALEPTWLHITGKPSEKYASLANPSCRDYLLGVLDDAPVADDQVERVCLLDQIVSLTHSAGLLSNTENSARRPELAHALMSRHIQVAESIRTFVDAAVCGENRPAREHTKVLREAADLLATYGSENDTDWLMDRIVELFDVTRGRLVLALVDLFMLAERLAGLETNAHDERERLTEELVMAAVSAIETTRDLDAYEALPDALKTAAVREVVRQRADEAIVVELDYFMRSADEPEAIRVAAANLEQLANWYGFQIDIGPLLDRADALSDIDIPPPEWRASDDQPEDPDSDDAALSIRQLFSRFSQ